MPDKPTKVISKALPGGESRLERVPDAPVGKSKVRPVPVTFARPEPTTRQKIAHTTAPVTRLGTPSALLMLGGLFLIYYALHGWDAKYGTFNGAFAGKGSVPTGTRARTTTAPVTTSSAPTVRTA